MDPKDIFSGKWREGEPVWKEPSKEERMAQVKEELVEAMKKGVETMLPEGTQVEFTQEGIEMSGKIRGISTMAIPLIGVLPAYIVELDDPSVIPPIKVGEEFEFEYSFSCLTVPKMIVKAVEATDEEEA